MKTHHIKIEDNGSDHYRVTSNCFRCGDEIVRDLHNTIPVMPGVFVLELCKKCEEINPPYQNGLVPEWACSNWGNYEHDFLIGVITNMIGSIARIV
ncbi:MAG: hypothetical protein DWQ19_12210 [Crenarchaeota archaeon]|nr:MAG: hypothetical protein DWQ19_12210 [Thermoproteota archaeon]